MANDFALDVEALRDRARREMEQGPVTPTYGGPVDRVIAVLNEVLATELVCWARYEQHAIVASGIHSAPVSDEFREHADQERRHAVAAAERINQLGGEPDFSPDALAKRSYTGYRTFEPGDIEAMLRENLVAERIVIQGYQEIIRWIADRDPTTRRMLEWILQQEEEHADDLSELLVDMGST